MVTKTNVTYVQNPGTDGSIILDFQGSVMGGGRMDWIDLAQNRDRWWALVNVVMNLWVP